MPNPENIKGKGFQPGKSGNPNGRPKGAKNSATVIARWLDTKEKVKSPFTKKEERLSQLDIAVLALIAKARKGDVSAFNALLDRAEGRVAQPMQHSGDPDGAPIQTDTVHRVIFEDYSNPGQ